MAETNRHKVFVSIQHGCEDTVRLCGKKIVNGIWGSQTTFNVCNGNCGRNRVYPNLNCVYYYKCGHYWKERFEFLMVDKTEKMVSKSVGDGDIPTNIPTETIRQQIRDNFIAEATVTVVLIGPETWKRKHVDWEISSSIKNTQKNPRCGLIGIMLPTYPHYNNDENTFFPYTIPPRLFYNHQTGFAHIYPWTENTNTIQAWINAAFERKDKMKIDNSYPMFRNNRSDDQTQWQP